MGLTLFVILLFQHIIRLALLDFDPQIAEKNTELFFKWSAAALVLACLGILFLFLAGILAIWS
jgi:hypothetical protein